MLSIVSVSYMHVLCSLNCENKTSSTWFYLFDLASFICEVKGTGFLDSEKYEPSYSANNVGCICIVNSKNVCEPEWKYFLKQTCYLSYNVLETTYTLFEIY